MGWKNLFNWLIIVCFIRKCGFLTIQRFFFHRDFSRGTSLNLQLCAYSENSEALCIDWYVNKIKHDSTDLTTALLINEMLLFTSETPSTVITRGRRRINLVKNTVFVFTELVKLCFVNKEISR